MGTTKKDPIKQAMQEALESLERAAEQAAEQEGEEPGDGVDQESDEEPEVIVEDPVADDGDDAAEAEAEDEPAAEVVEVSPEDKIADLNDQLLRLAADFENYRKRARREQDELRKYGIEQVVRAMLPVIDNLERALGHADSTDPVLQGVQMVVKQFGDALSTYGVQSFTSVGEAFDPERHEAMGQAPTDEVPAGAVFQELEKGYTLHDRLLRPAKVLVAVPPPESDDTTAEDENS